MPGETIPRIAYPLIEARLEKIESYLRTMASGRMCEIIIEDYRKQLVSQLESLSEPPSDEQLRQILNRMESPELVLLRAGVVAMSQSSNQPIGSDGGFGVLNPQLPLLDLAKRGLLVSVISSCVSCASPIFQWICMVGAFRTGSTRSRWVIAGIGIVHSVAMLSIATLGVCTSYQALKQLRRENGRFAGYGHATAGLVLGVVALLITLVPGIIVLPELFNQYFIQDFDQ